MSVVIETTLGDITVDLFINDRPRACLNFLKLCKIKYYNYNLFHTISRGFIAQTGDPTGSGSGGGSIYGVLDGAQKRYFEGENEPRIKHTKMGLISFVGNEERMVGSQFFFTLGEDLTYLDEKHCVFGEVVEGFDVLEVINEVICDNDDRPYQDVRVTHTVILDDPFPNPKRLITPSRSPSPSAERLKGGRIAPDEEIDEMEGKSQEEVSEIQADREAKARATILEMVGDLPDADMAPPENVLFVCKLNPVTNDDDLEIIFSRFGKIKSCEVIRDKKTGDSLQYAFVEFEDKASCENAYFKMDNVLIDDRRIHVDFSQSVSKVKWRGKGRGVIHYDARGRKNQQVDADIGKGNYKHKKNYDSSRNSEETSNKKDERSRSPSDYKKYKSANYERPTSRKSGSEYSRKSKNDDRSSKNRRKSTSPSPERRIRYYKSPTTKYNSSDRDKSTSKSNRDISYTPKKRKYSPSSPRRGRINEKTSSSTRYMKNNSSPKRRKESSPISKTNRDNRSSTRRRSRSLTPKKDSTRKNGHEKSDSRDRKVSSSYKNRNKSRGDEEGSDSDSEDTTKYDRKNTKYSSKRSDRNESRDCPEREEYISKSAKSYDKDKMKNHKRKKDKVSKYSSSEVSDSEREFKTNDSESSDNGYGKRKSKKKKSSKKSKRYETSSDSDDHKKKKKKKRKYESSSD